VQKKIHNEFGFEPDFIHGKELLEEAAVQETPSKPLQNQSLLVQRLLEQQR